MNKYTNPDLGLFEENFNGYEVPEKLKAVAIAIMKRFVLTGVCDGMYIANVLAEESGMGDGQSHFNGRNLEISPSAADFLMGAYRSNIDSREDLDEIIRTGALSADKMRNGLQGLLKELKAEKRTCDEVRKPYVQRRINYGKALLGML